MSEQTIKEKSQVIRNETNKYANTRERVADVLDDINETKANKDASELSEEDKKAWKRELGVGELPDNLAKIDKEGEEGNTYTKDQANIELTKKLDKPTITDDGHNYPYVVLVDEFGDSAQAPAVDLGKNMANSRLTTTTDGSITQGANYTWNTAGYHYYITGLPNKSADTTFNRMRVQDANGQEAWSNGKAVLENLLANLPDATEEPRRYNVYPVLDLDTNTLAKSLRPQVITNFNIPTNIRITQDVNMPGVVVNVNPEYPEDLKRAINKIKEINQLGFTKVRKDELIVKTMEEQFFPEQVRGKYTFPPNLIEKPEDGCFIFNGFGILSSYSSHFTSIQYINYIDRIGAKALYNVFVNKEMPSDRDWVIKVRTHSNYNNYSNGNKGHCLGFRGEVSHNADYTLNDTFVRLGGSGPSDVNTIFTKKSSYANTSIFIEVYFIKQGNLLVTVILDIVSNNYMIEVNEYKEEFKKLYFYINPSFYGFQRGQVIFKDISYWIQP